jgi:TM2 domain-containing membrane protein YozV
MNTCEKCGKDSPDESEFCISCGTRFCAELHRLLADNGLEAYFGVFRRNHILTPDEVALLQESNFDELGIAAIGDRARLKSAIRSLRGDEATVSELPPVPASSVIQDPASATAVPLQHSASHCLPKPKSRVAYILLAVFLGCFGVHNFYAGRVVPGVIQLLVTILSGFILSFATWIWAVVEAATVKADGKNVPFK